MAIHPIAPPQRRTLDQQVVLITGASTGIGAALAVMLATRYPGIQLVIAARSRDQLEQVAQHCRDAGAEVLVVPTDMTNLEQVDQLASQALQRFGRVDAVVNNAGYGQMGPIELVPAAAVRRQFETNLFGGIHLLQALIPVMREQGGGRIVNVSSLGGRLAFPLGGLYSASKFALEGLSDALRMELSPFNIRVSVVEPGPVKTEFFEVASQRVQQDVEIPPQSPYQAALQQLDQIEQQVNALAWSAERVAEVIVQALAAPSPKPRYIAATAGPLMVALMTKLLPTWMVDLFWKRFYGVHRIEAAWRQQRRQSGLVPSESDSVVQAPPAPKG
ncbi:MAG: SDR family oxidoreductase [Synechococcales cyanobacterium C42_A2020_086]|jgi:NAD(P)-dependent dehydrogenase (short-subunit alcohol dehydrogenase family)|nr:SDR family oxidoreductase [Synechococcales cyanobacterium C42_A2020_086]